MFKKVDHQWGAALRPERICVRQTGNEEMRIERRYTKAACFTLRLDRISEDQERDPQSGRLGRVLPRQYRGSRRPGARWRPTCSPRNISARPAFPARLKRVEENSVPSFLWRSVADEAALELLPKAERYGSETSAQQVFDRLAGAWTYWGWKGHYFKTEEDARAFYRRNALHAGAPDGRAQFAAMVQHRPALGLWHRWAGAGPLLRRLRDGQADEVEILLRTSAAARLFHPVRRRRSRQRRRHYGSLGARGAPVQIWLGHRLEFLGFARREREALGRRPLERPDVVPEDRRPRGGRDQIGRHDAARRQNGGGRRRPSRYRGLYRLEGQRGAEGRGAGRPAPRSSSAI